MQAEPRRKKRKTYNEPGHAHELTFSCYKRLPILDDEAKFAFLENLENVRRNMQVEVWAYVLMPEHVHLLIWPTQPVYCISTILGKLKDDFAKRQLARIANENPALLSKLTVQQNGKAIRKFWQPGGGFDRNMYSPNVIRAAIEYIHANPVRRGLVEDVYDWPWSSARSYLELPDVVFDFDRCPHL